MELADGSVITGKTSVLLGASSAMSINVLKKLANIPDEIPLLSPSVIEPIQKLKLFGLGFGLVCQVNTELFEGLLINRCEHNS